MPKSSSFLCIHMSVLLINGSRACYYSLEIKYIILFIGFYNVRSIGRSACDDIILLYIILKLKLILTRHFCSPCSSNIPLLQFRRYL